MTFELGPIPWSLASVEETLVKTAKSSLLAVLESNFPPAEAVPEDAAYMVDGMAVLQSLTRAPSTFADLASALFQIITVPFSLAANVLILCVIVIH